MLEKIKSKCLNEEGKMHTSLRITISMVILVVLLIWICLGAKNSSLSEAINEKYSLITFIVSGATAFMVVSDMRLRTILPALL
jgi:uncharacterized membrane-anchored protein